MNFIIFKSLCNAQFFIFSIFTGNAHIVFFTDLLAQWVKPDQGFPAVYIGEYLFI